MLSRPQRLRRAPTTETASKEPNATENAIDRRETLRPARQIVNATNSQQRQGPISSRTRRRLLCELGGTEAPYAAFRSPTILRAPSGGLPAHSVDLLPRSGRGG